MNTKQYAMEFVEALRPLAEYTAYVLNKDGAEALVLGPLGAYPESAGYAARSMATAPSSYIRCVACLIPSFTPRGDPELLLELWKNETERRANPSESIRADLEEADANPEAFGLPLDAAELGLDDDPGDQRPAMTMEERVAYIAGLEANSVAERVVMSCMSFLERGPDHKGVAWRVLEDMLARSLRGEDWNDAHFALALLVRSGHPRGDSFLTRAAALEGGPEHLASWARQINGGNRALLDEPLRLVGPVPGDVELPDGQRAELEAVLEAAQLLESSLE